MIRANWNVGGRDLGLSSMPRDEIIRRGQEEYEPHCLVEGVRRVVDGEVQLHFNRVVARK